MAEKAFGTLALIGQGTGWNVMFLFYKALVEQYLECVQFWSPCTGKDGVKVEKLQSRFTRLGG